MGNPGLAESMPRGGRQGPSPRWGLEAGLQSREGCSRSGQGLHVRRCQTRAQLVETVQEIRHPPGMKAGTGPQEQGCPVAELQTRGQGNLRLSLLRSGLAPEIGH